MDPRAGVVSGGRTNRNRGIFFALSEGFDVDDAPLDDDGVVEEEEAVPSSGSALAYRRAITALRT